VWHGRIQRIGGPRGPIEFVELDNACAGGGINNQLFGSGGFGWLIVDLNRENMVPSSLPDRTDTVLNKRSARDKMVVSAETRFCRILDRKVRWAKLSPIAAYGLGGACATTRKELVDTLSAVADFVSRVSWARNKHWGCDS